jgi:hypothetical protein
VRATRGICSGFGVGGIVGFGVGGIVGFGVGRGTRGSSKLMTSGRRGFSARACGMERKNGASARWSPSDTK